MANRIVKIPVSIVRQNKAVKAAKKALALPRQDKLVVFVCEKIHVRIIKIAFAAKSSGWRVVLLYRDDFSFDVSDYFIETKKVKDKIEALKTASSYQPITYHIFSNYNFETVHFFIRNKPGKIVFDNYDLLTGMVKDGVAKVYSKQIALERYCYHNADGLCCRDLRVQYVEGRLPKQILFSEYCWPADKFPRQHKLTDGVHVVYVGSIEVDPKSIESYQYPLAALFSKKRIHLHIYPSHQHNVEPMREHMKNFVEPEMIGKYVHVHDTISPLTMISEISKYHYGLLISTNKVDFVDEGTTYYHHMGDFLLPSKLFDYMEAGIYTFSQNAKFIRFVLERYGSGEVVNSLAEIAEKADTKILPQVVIPASITLEANAERLVKFYMEL